jgi:hypothetical protein
MSRQRPSPRLFQNGEQAWFLVAFGGVALAGRAVILVQGKQGRLLGWRRRLCAAQRHQFTPEIPAAVNFNEAWEGHNHVIREGGRSQASAHATATASGNEPGSSSIARRTASGVVFAAVG